MPDGVANNFVTIDPIMLNPIARQIDSREFGAYFLSVLVLSCGLFFTLQTTGMAFLTPFAGVWLEDVAISLLPSFAAILAIALGGFRYADLEVKRVDKINAEIQRANDAIDRRNAEIDPAKRDGPLSSPSGHDGSYAEHIPLETRHSTRMAAGDSCYYISFLLTLWGLFLELTRLGGGLREGSLGLQGNSLVGDLIAGNGLALLSTIVGLVARFIIALAAFVESPPKSSGWAISAAKHGAQGAANPAERRSECFVLANRIASGSFGKLR